MRVTITLDINDDDLAAADTTDPLDVEAGLAARLEEFYPSVSGYPVRAEIRTFGVVPPFAVGDWALHTSNTLDAREVVAVFPSRNEIMLAIGGTTATVSAENYRKTGA